MVKKTQKINAKLGPNYLKIYIDIIKYKFPNMHKELDLLQKKDQLNFFEVVELNKKMFGEKKKEYNQQAQKYKAYEKETILYILRYQKSHKLNNSQTSLYFNMSRNTLARWKKIFKDLI